MTTPETSTPILTPEQVADLRAVPHFKQTATDTWSLRVGDVERLCDSHEALRAALAAREQDRGYDAEWQAYRDATVLFLRNRARRYAASGTIAGTDAASELATPADALEAQVQFRDAARAASPSTRALGGHP